MNKCCKNCKTSVNGVIDICEDLNCHCHLQENNIKCNCGYANGLARWHSPDCSIFYKTPILQESKEEQCFCPSYYDNDGELKDCICGKCATAKDITQEPMEWAKEIREQFFEYMENGYSGGKDGLRCDVCDGKYSGSASLRQLCPMCKAEKLIKQAEERGYKRGKEFERDMTNNGYIPTAIEIEKERILKDIIKLDNKWKNKDGDFYFHIEEYKKDIITLINQNNEKDKTK